MSEKATAKLFMHGRSQAVRLPKEFRLPGKEVYVRRVGDTVVLEPIGTTDRARIAAVFAEIDRRGGRDFLPEGRPEQPPMPVDERKYFDD
jgi:antitoxin VapB